MNKIRVLIVDDHNITRDGLETLVQARAVDIEVVGTASDGREALARVEELRPDVVLMDVRMPNLDGVQATSEIRRRFPEVKVLILTTFDEEKYIVGGMTAGASGYLLKDVLFPELVEAIQVVHHGGVLMKQDVARVLINRLKSGDSPAIDGVAVEDNFLAGEILSRKEREILRLVAEGMENAGIAKKLFLSEGTVRNYVSRIYELIGVHDRAQAVVWALRHNLIK